VGGDGLLSGSSLSAHYFSTNCEVYGAEPEGAADAIYSFETGKVEHAKFAKTIADGLQMDIPAQRIPPIPGERRPVIPAERRPLWA
jgi:threonine dehydratase